MTRTKKQKPYKILSVAVSAAIAMAFSLHASAITVTASSQENSTNSAQRVIDNDLGTRWSAKGDGEWVKLDLGSTSTVDDISIAFHKGDERLADIEIETSTNNSSWTTVFNGTQPKYTKDLIKFEITDRSARYVRVTGFGNSSNTWNSITEIDVNTLGGTTPTPTPSSGPLDRGGWSLSSSRNSGDLSAAIDSSKSSRWTTEQSQRAGQWIVIDLGSSQNVNQIVLDSENSSNDYPRQYQVFASNSTSNWGSAVASGSGSSTTTIAFSQVNARYLRIEQNGSDNYYWWSIHDLNVYANGTPSPTPTPTPPTPTTPTPTPNPTGSEPSDFFVNCDQWKITWIDGSEEKKLCDQGERNGQYEVSPNGDALVFTVPLNGSLGTTSDETDYSRSELRERKEDGSSDIYWTTDGDHALYIQQAITHLPINKDHLVAGQIHGNKNDGIDDSMVVRLEGDHLFLSFNGGKLRDEVTIKRGYNLGDKFEVILRIVDGKHYAYYSEDGNLRNAYNSGNANGYLVKDGSNSVLLDIDYDQVYFKVGNYTQSSEETEEEYFGRSDNYGQVYVYAFDVNHKGEDL